MGPYSQTYLFDCKAFTLLLRMPYCLSSSLLASTNCAADLADIAQDTWRLGTNAQSAEFGCSLSEKNRFWNWQIGVLVAKLGYLDGSGVSWVSTPFPPNLPQLPSCTPKMIARAGSFEYFGIRDCLVCSPPPLVDMSKQYFEVSHGQDSRHRFVGFVGGFRWFCLEYYHGAVLGCAESWVSLLVW